LTVFEEKTVPRAAATRFICQCSVLVNPFYAHFVIFRFSQETATANTDRPVPPVKRTSRRNRHNRSFLAARC